MTKWPSELMCFKETIHPLLVSNWLQHKLKGSVKIPHIFKNVNFEKNLFKLKLNTVLFLFAVKLNSTQRIIGM